MDDLTALDPTLLDLLAQASAWSAAERAVESMRDDALFDDPLAEDFAISGGIDIFDELAPSIVRGSRSLSAHRTQFLDDFVLRCTRTEGFRQVVILGSGFDSRAFRLDLPRNTVVFEIDSSSTHVHKARTLAAFDVEADCDRRVVMTNLNAPWHDDLFAAGFDSHTPTAWIADGILEHFTPDVARAMIATASHLSASESRLGADFVDELTSSPSQLLASTGWHADLATRPGDYLTTYLRFVPDAECRFELEHARTTFTASTRLNPRG